MAELLEEQLEKARGSWLYVGLVVLSIEVVLGVAIFSVLPRILELYQSFGFVRAALPQSTQILLSLRESLIKNSILIPLILGGELLLWRGLSESGAGPRFVAKHKERLGVFIMIALGLAVGLLAVSLVAPIYSVLGV